MFSSRAECIARASISTRMTVWVALIFLVLGIAGCGGLEPVAPYDSPTKDPAQLPARLVLNARALTLSTAPTYNTWEMTATIRNPLGEEISGLPTPTFRSSDVSTVQVTADGQLTALKEGSVQILAELVAPGNIRLIDSARVNVTALDPAPTLSTLSIEPVAPDSTIRPVIQLPPGPSGTGVIDIPGLNGPFRITPTALDAVGETIAGIPFEFESLDPGIMVVIPGDDWQTVTIRPMRPGQARVVVRTTAYGTTMVDTTVFTVTMPTYADVVVKAGDNGIATFNPDEVHIRTNGVVFWFNKLDHEVDITFDDPSAAVEVEAIVCSALNDMIVIYELLDPRNYCVPGNFTLLVPSPTDSDGRRTLTVRRFVTPGVYVFHSTTTGTTGRILVSDDGSEP